MVDSRSNEQLRLNALKWCDRQKGFGETCAKAGDHCPRTGYIAILILKQRFECIKRHKS